MSFRPVNDEENINSQSQKRPLVVGISDRSEPANLLESYNNDISESNLKIDNTAREYNDKKEKGTVETENVKCNEGNESNGTLSIRTSDESALSKDSINTSIELEAYVDQTDELCNVFEELVDVTKDGESRPRLTTDSGINSRGSSFSSEPDLSISSESMLEMKKYLHGKTDALYQPFENGKLKSLGDTDISIMSLECGSHSSLNQISTSKANYGTETRSNEEFHGTHWDMVGELEARVLAGKYLFDNGPAEGEAERSKQALLLVEFVNQSEKYLSLSAESVSSGQLLNDNDNLITANASVPTFSEIIRDNEVDIDTNFSQLDDAVKYSKLSQKIEEDTKETTIAQSSVSNLQTEYQADGVETDINDLHTQKLNKQMPKLYDDSVENYSETETDENEKMLSPGSSGEAYNDGSIIDNRMWKTALPTQNIEDGNNDYDQKSKNDDNYTLVNIDIKIDENEEAPRQTIPQTSIDVKNYKPDSNSCNTKSYVDENGSNEGIVKGTDDETNNDVDNSQEVVNKVVDDDGKGGNDKNTFNDSSFANEVSGSSLGAIDEITNTYSNVDDPETDANVNMLSTTDIKNGIYDHDISYTDDESIDFDLDVDRKEETISTRSKQFRRSSAQDSMTKEIAEQLLAQERMTINNGDITLESSSCMTFDLKEPKEEFDLDLDRKEETTYNEQDKLLRLHSQKRGLQQEINDDDIIQVMNNEKHSIALHATTPIEMPKEDAEVINKLASETNTNKDTLTNSDTAFTDTVDASDAHYKGKMQREDEHPGLLDHTVKDDEEDRILAGKYLFFHDTDGQEKSGNREREHEFHYLHEAEGMAEIKSEDLPLQTVLKNVSSPLETYEIENEETSKMSAEFESSVHNAKFNKIDDVHAVTKSNISEMSENLEEMRTPLKYEADTNIGLTPKLVDDNNEASASFSKDFHAKTEMLDETAVKEDTLAFESMSNSKVQEASSISPCLHHNDESSVNHVAEVYETVEDIDNITSEPTLELSTTEIVKLADSVHKTYIESRSDEFSKEMDAFTSTAINTVSKKELSEKDAIPAEDRLIEKTRTQMSPTYVKEIKEDHYWEKVDMSTLDWHTNSEMANFEVQNDIQFEIVHTAKKMNEDTQLIAARENETVENLKTDNLINLEDTQSEVPNILNLVEEINENKMMSCNSEKGAGFVANQTVNDNCLLEQRENALQTVKDIEQVVEPDITPPLQKMQESSLESANIVVSNENNQEGEIVETTLISKSENTSKNTRDINIGQSAPTKEREAEPLQEAEDKCNETDIQTIEHTIKTPNSDLDMKNIANISDLNEQLTDIFENPDYLDEEKPAKNNEESKTLKHPTVKVLLGCSEIDVQEKDPIELKWKITGISSSEITICKDGFKIEPDDRLRLDFDSDICTVFFASAGVSDDATYSLRVNNLDNDEGEIVVKVVALDISESAGDSPSEPVFVVEPTVDVADERRLSIKCAVSGYPLPEVKWYLHGQQLSQDALWDVYLKDGYHHLGVGDSSLLDCEQIVCRVENELGLLQSVILLKKNGDELYCEAVLPGVSREPVLPGVSNESVLSQVSTEPSQLSGTAPSIELEVSETSSENLLQLTVGEAYTDQHNFVFVQPGEVVQVLSLTVPGAILARHSQMFSKICYLPHEVLHTTQTEVHDVSNQECKNLRETHAGQVINKPTEKQETKALNNSETDNSANMPERRKMKSPSPKMTSTPKMKRKDKERDSPTELHTRLGIKENLTSKKDVSQDSIDLSDYTDGTTRPSFQKRLRNVSAKTGEQAQLECVVSGTPLPKVLWLKNNRPLKTADGCKVTEEEGTNILLFPSASDDDVGVYTARAMNMNGSIIASAEFTLTDGKGLSAQTLTEGPMDMDFTTPIYFFEMSSCEVSEGQLARFDCRVVAYPKPEIVWMRNGQVVESGGRFKLLNFNNEIYSLLIQDVHLSDTGRYTCWARNQFGEAMTETRLNVIALTDQEEDGDLAPKFLTRFYDQQTTEGTATDFKCLIAGRPEPSVTWLLEDEELRDAPGMRLRRKDGMASLEIKTPKADHSGMYTCQLRNPLGEAKCSAKLKVIEDKLHGKMLPKFLKKFDHTNAKDGEEVKFTCIVVGEPKPEITWMFDHKPISDTNRRYVMKREGDAYTLIIKNLRFDDGGTITCKASNVEGEVYCSANLNIRESKFQPDMPDKSGFKTKDEKDSKFGYVPTFTKRLHDVEVKEGALAAFECRIMGIPEPEVSWMRDGRVITPGGRYHMTQEGGTCRLTIANVSSSDTGIYTCIISNTQGKSSSTAELKLEGAKKERFTPEKFLDDRTAKKERYTPDKYLLEDGYTSPAKRPFLESDRIEAKPRKRYERSSSFDDSSFRRPKKSYESPVRTTYDDMSFSRPKKFYESPVRSTYDDKSLTRPKTTYESPVRSTYDDSSLTRPKKTYESPVRSTYDDALLTRPKRYDDTPLVRPRSMYDSPVRTVTFDTSLTRPRSAYGSPGRSSAYDDTSLTRPRSSYGSPGRSSAYDDTSLTRPRSSYGSPGRSSAYDDTSLTRPRSSYGSPGRSSAYDDTSLTRPRSSYGSPGRSSAYDDTSLTRPRSSYGSPGRSSAYDDTSFSRPIRSYDSPVLSTYDDISLTRAKRLDEISRVRPRSMYDSPVRSSYDDISLMRLTYAPEETIKRVPKIPYDRPTILNKCGDSIRLAWLPASTYDLPADARRISYVVESRELPRNEWTKIATAVPSTSYLVQQLRSDKEYEFRVRAQNQHGVSEPTWVSPLEKRADEMRRFADLPEMRAPPRLPTHRPIITDLGEETVRLAWRPVEAYQAKRSPPVSYRLEAKELPGKDWMPLSDRLRDTTHYLSDLARDRDYMIRVRAENDFGISEPTEPLWLPRARAFPGVPVTRPEIIDYDATHAKLSWTRVDIPTFGFDDVPLTYMLEVEEPPHDWRTVARDLDDTEYLVEGLNLGRDYRFRVRAKTPTGVLSEPSPAASLYTTLARSRAPVDRMEVLEYEPDLRSVHLSWQRVDIPPYNLDEEPLMYMLEYNEPPLPDWKPLVTGIPTTRYRVSHLDPLRDYNFRVRAVTSYGLSPPSPALPVTLRPSSGLPSLTESVIISEVEPDSVRLTWRRPVSYDLSTPISYQIELLEPPMSDWRPIASRLTDTTYKVTGLKPTKDYQFRVIPVVDSRLLAPTYAAGLTSSSVRPRLPFSEPTLKELSPESVQLSWRPAEFPVYERSRAPLYYGVQMMELPSSNWVPVARRVPDTTYTVTGLRPDRDYKFRVLAETDSLSSEPGPAASLYRRPTPRFQRNEPTILDISPNIVQLSWQPADISEGYGDISYQVEVQTPPGIASWTTLHAHHPTPSVRLADLRPDLDYLVRVRAQSGDYVTEPTLPVYIPRRAVPPRIPVDEPYAVEINPDSIKLQWRSADLPSHILNYAPVTYRLEACELPGSNWMTVAHGIPHTDFKVTGLNPLKDYAFRVRAMNDYGTSDPTRPITIQKRSVAPVLPHDEPMMYDISSDSVRLSWRPATQPSHIKSPTTYTIYVQELPFKTWRPLVRGIPHTSYYVSGLRPDKEYNFRIQAENEFGSSRPTEAVYLPKFTDLKRPISIPEVSDFAEDLTSGTLRWKRRASSPFDKSPHKYLIETWEPMRREWKSVAREIPDTSYHMRGLPVAQDHLFRVRMETEQEGLSEPSLPVSVSRYYNYPRVPVYRPQLYEVDKDTVKLSWQPASFIPDGTTRRPFKCHLAKSLEQWQKNNKRGSSVNGVSTIEFAATLQFCRYCIEQREIPDSHWHTVVSDLHDTHYRLKGLRPKSDYEFRVRTIIDGVTSEPSLPVPLYRRSVIPRVRFDMPEVEEVDDTSLSLRWNKVEIPSFSAYDEPLSFMIERQQLPHYEWEQVASNITGSRYTIRDLMPNQDYNFRVRGVYPSGYTEPSPYVPVYRRPIRHSVPIARTEVWEEEPYSARLRWHRAYISPYSSSPLRYRIEMQEAGVSTENDQWREVATDITTTDFTVPEISPKKDYNFRIRAEMENGDISDATPPIQYYRSQLPMTREPFSLAEYKPVDYDITFANHPYIDHLTKYVPPRIPIDKPDMVIINVETVELSWKPARIPESIRHSSNLTYTIEVRTPPSFEWRELISSLKVRNHTVKSLHPKIDYIFRVRAWNEYGCSEPSLPVSLYRPVQYDAEDDDEDFEREWQLRFGQQDGTEVPIDQVPPKLPIDTPNIVTQTPNSIWFTWLPARIPVYATKTPITYVIEMKEPPSNSWRRDVTGLIDCQYVREGLSSTQDYYIRVKAETEFGSSESTLPIVIKRSSGSRPGSRRSSLERDLKNDDASIDTTYLDNLTAGVPPRMTSNRPLCTNSAADRLTISWSACRVPSYVKNSNVMYIIEKRELPGHVWTVLARDIKTTRYDITGLIPDSDYMFRVRAKNDFGISDPTLPLSIYRERDDYVPQKIRSRSGSRDSITAMTSWRGRRSSSIDYGSVRSEGSDPDMEACQRDKIPMQPEYITTTYDTQYGVEGKKGKITLQVRGYPLPIVHWYCGEEKLKYGDKYNAFVTSQGGITLEIQNVGAEDAGQYKCYAENESGAAVKVVTFELAEPPTILEPLREQLELEYKTITITCRVDAFPSPTIKWLKDWRPLSDSQRVKMIHTKPDTFSLEITEALMSDSGVYSCTIENIAGKVTCMGKLTVEESIPSFKEIVLKTTPIEDLYHVQGEIARGRHGVVRRVTEVSTGKTYAANYIYMRNKAQKNFFMSEYEILRSITQMDGVLRLHDAFETERCLILVTEILTAPDLLEKMIADGDWTEARVAGVVKQLLTTLKELESLSILHLDIKPSNIRMCGLESSDAKLINFALARFLLPDEDIMHNYGTVGYASPEQVTNDVLRENTDVWAVGVLTYVLLSGVAPFQGNTDVDILNKTVECQWSFGEKDFEKISKDGQEFISQLLVKDPSKRLGVEECLNHLWLSTESDTKINTDKLRQFYNMEKLKRKASQVYTTAHLQSLRKILHGTAALYQPAIDTDTGEIIFPDSDEYGDYLDEDAWYEWQLQYLDDPDSQEFPIQKKEFTLRESRHTAANKVKEEEKEEPESGSGIMFRNKIQSQTFLVGEDATFSCTVVSQDEVPVVTWYRDEQLLSEAYRADPSFNEETGVAKLRIVNSKDYDAAIYKCVARNKDGRVSCQARLLLGDKPGKPGRPLVTQTSGAEAFLTWTGPVSDGNSYILGYRVDYRKQGDSKWTKGPYVTEEYALLNGLVPNTSYTFRVSCHNKYGTSPYSWASLEAATLDTDAPAITIAAHLQPLLQFTSFTKQQLILPAESRRPSLTVVDEAIIQEINPADNYTITDTISKGSYGEYKACSNTATNQQCVMKIVPYNKDNHAAVTSEFEILRSLRQINIITVLDSYIDADLFYVVFERLSGINVLQYLCLQKSYKEELVAQIVRQILDALQYLQHYGIAHLNLQPSSIVMATRRRPHVKLRDFTLARKIEAGKEESMTPAGYPDFVPPEVIKGDPVQFSSDLWTLGALTFTLLSGVSPFGGNDLKGTLSNILFDRYNLSDMYDNVSKESLKFISKLLRRLPKNRPDVNKCLDSRWLQLSDTMLKSRNSRIFQTEKLIDFSQLYQQRRADPEYMAIAAVAVQDLPKPTPGPVVQPILTDKIANRHVFRLKQKSKSRSKSNSPMKAIRQEKAIVEDETLLNKVVRKAENEMKSENENIGMEDEKVVKIEGFKAENEMKLKSGKTVMSDEKLDKVEGFKTESGMKLKSGKTVMDDEKLEKVEGLKAENEMKLKSGKTVDKVVDTKKDFTVQSRTEVTAGELKDVVDGIDTKEDKVGSKNNSLEISDNKTNATLDKKSETQSEKKSLSPKDKVEAIADTHVPEKKSAVSAEDSTMRQDIDKKDTDVSKITTASSDEEVKKGKDTSGNQEEVLETEGQVEKPGHKAVMQENEGKENATDEHQKEKSLVTMGGEENKQAIEDQNEMLLENVKAAEKPESTPVKQLTTDREKSQPQEEKDTTQMKKEVLPETVEAPNKTDSADSTQIDDNKDQKSEMQQGTEQPSENTNSTDISTKVKNAIEQEDVTAENQSKQDEKTVDKSPLSTDKKMSETPQAEEEVITPVSKPSDELALLSKEVNFEDKVNKLENIEQMAEMKAKNITNGALKEIEQALEKIDVVDSTKDKKEKENSPTPIQEESIKVKVKMEKLESAIEMVDTIEEHLISKDSKSGNSEGVLEEEIKPQSKITEEASTVTDAINRTNEDEANTVEQIEQMAEMKAKNITNGALKETEQALEKIDVVDSTKDKKEKENSPVQEESIKVEVKMEKLESAIEMVDTIEEHLISKDSKSGNSEGVLEEEIKPQSKITEEASTVKDAINRTNEDEANTVEQIEQMAEMKAKHITNDALKEIEQALNKMDVIDSTKDNQEEIKPERKITEESSIKVTDTSLIKVATNSTKEETATSEQSDIKLETEHNKLTEKSLEEKTKKSDEAEKIQTSEISDAASANDSTDSSNSESSGVSANQVQSSTEQSKTNTKNDTTEQTVQAEVNQSAETDKAIEVMEPTNSSEVKSQEMGTTERVQASEMESQENEIDTVEKKSTVKVAESIHDKVKEENVTDIASVDKKDLVEDKEHTADDSGHEESKTKSETIDSNASENQNINTTAVDAKENADKTCTDMKESKTNETNNTNTNETAVSAVERSVKSSTFETTETTQITETTTGTAEDLVENSVKTESSTPVAVDANENVDSSCDIGTNMKESKMNEADSNQTNEIALSAIERSVESSKIESTEVKTAEFTPETAEEKVEQIGKTNENNLERNTSTEITAETTVATQQETVTKVSEMAEETVEESIEGNLTRIVQTNIEETKGGTLTETVVSSMKEMVEKSSETCLTSLGESKVIEMSSEAMESITKEKMASLIEANLMQTSQDSSDLIKIIETRYIIKESQIENLNEKPETSADCGKYLTGSSHGAEKKDEEKPVDVEEPDEEEIARQLMNQCILDDALLFC